MLKHHRTQAGLLGLFLLLLVAGLCLVTCDEAPFAPVIVESTDYPVYFINSSSVDSTLLFAYHPIDGNLDTNHLEWHAGMEWLGTYGPTVSHDGSLLYLVVTPNVYVYDTDSWSITNILLYRTLKPVVVSPDGEYIAIRGDSLWILSTVDYEPVYIDTLRALDVEFSAWSSCVYYVSFAEGGSEYTQTLCRVDLSSVEQVESIVTWDYGIIDQITVLPGDSRCLVHANLGTYVDGFWDYSPNLDSAMFDYIYAPGGGEVELTTDGQFAFFGNPGGNIGGPTPQDGFYTYDVTRHEMDGFISTRFFVDSVTPNKFGVREIEITPDNRWLIGLEGPTSHSLFCYDLKQKTFLDYLLLGYQDMEIRHISVQSSH